MKTSLFACLLATSALAVTPAFAANTMAASPAPAATAMTATSAHAVRIPAWAQAPAPVPMPVSATAPASAPAMTVARLQIKQSSKFGRYLVDGSGRPLYVFSADTRGGDDVQAKSACTSACAVAWPPATIKNMPNAASGIDKSDLATIARADGIKQLTYDGRPLYLFVHDKGASSPKGQAIRKFGGEWNLVTPSGAKNLKGIA